MTTKYLSNYGIQLKNFLRTRGGHGDVSPVPLKTGQEKRPRVLLTEPLHKVLLYKDSICYNNYNDRITEEKTYEDYRDNRRNGAAGCRQAV